MDQTAKKIEAARTALKYVENGAILGVGTGSTVNCFIDELGGSGIAIEAAISSSEASTSKLKAIGVRVIDLNEAPKFDIYVDGADESNSDLQLIKGGGGALTREKIVAQAARTFVCIVDDTKMVDTLGAFPLPIEVIPMAASQVSQSLHLYGGNAQLRDDFVTDNGNVILDIHGLSIDHPLDLESELNQIPGVVTVGLFARRPADVLIVGASEGITTFEGSR